MNDRDKAIAAAILLWLLWPSLKGTAQAAWVGWTVDGTPVPLVPPPEPVTAPIGGTLSGLTVSSTVFVPVDTPASFIADLEGWYPQLSFRKLLDM